jgi:hypothetical protein
MQPQLYSVQVQWLSPHVGGRAVPPAGPVYAATARIADDDVDKQFSFALRVSLGQGQDDQSVQEADLRLANPDFTTELAPRLQPGRQLLLQEGKRIVGLCKIMSARPLAPQDKAALSLG